MTELLNPETALLPRKTRTRRTRPLRSCRVVLAGLVAAIGLSSCFKADMDIKVGSGDKIAGTMVVGVDKKVLSLFGQSEADFLKEMRSDNNDIPKGAKVSDYKTKQWIGQKLEFSNLPLSEFAKITGDTASAGTPVAGDDFKLERVGNTYVFSGEMDFTAKGLGGDLSGATGSGTQATDMFKNLEVRIKLTFPGKITSSDKDAKVSGKSVEWKPKFGKKYTMKAIANVK